ncbi:cinnamoyl-CoA reductase 1 [Caerostris darwini]|uniref:Cinnamoyl-CoA reductase 1 n=1 Tax=Caerostris darwini TaxID=1538125 RepID=A0AAV4SNC4_9ARAC|nr:cinnamoyl-CoA reductase 1 [Caerostris darwini]
MASGGETATVLVTGASGYVAAHIVKLLLEEGYKVRGTVRDAKNEEKVKPLKELCPDATYPLELVEADLLKEETWKEAVKDCSYVIHTASPFPSAPPANADDVIKPALDGTKNVLQACADSGSVKRVVVTSSIVAIHGEMVMEEGKEYTEGDWTNTESSSLDAYSKSKTLAERAAWDFVKELPEDKKFELAVINPGLVLGPVLSGTSSTSVEIIKKLLERSVPMVPKVNFAVCDVRDVALAHLKAMTLPNAADHRHIICTQNVWFKDIALALSKEFKPHGYSIPTMVAPYFAVWLSSCVDKTTRTILPRIGREFRFDNKRMRDELGITPKELNQTLIDTAYSLIDNGLVKKSKKYKQNRKDSVADQKNADTEEKTDQSEKTESKENEEKVESEEKEENKELEPEDKPEKLINGENEIKNQEGTAAQ